MQNNPYSPELKDLLTNIEAALIRAGQNACILAERTGTKLIVRERKTAVSRPQVTAKNALSSPLPSERSRG